MDPGAAKSVTQRIQEHPVTQRRPEVPSTRPRRPVIEEE